MKIIEPAVEIITEQNPLKRIELCGRVCYKSEDKITDYSAYTFVKNIISRGHTSVLEHARIVVNSIHELNKFFHKLSDSCLFGKGDLTLRQASSRVRMYQEEQITLNARDYLLFFPNIDAAALIRHKNADDYMTVRFICDRAIANELVRHRVFSFSQESTRYVNYKNGIEFIRPVPFDWAQDCEDKRFCAWEEVCRTAEVYYKELVENGCSPQEARNVLPLSTKTELIMTGTHKQWEDMLKLRLNRAAHPQMQYLMRLLICKQNFPTRVINVTY